ncbi:MAG: LuxR family transcriptional regulator [Proteobacteria bacterium]|nr:LuxR family transcriptional regulator [Pseudomonadota bacterium]MCH8321967.1 LuxR family transcriptional regulator [Pseudomonadota bacterium]
MAYAVSDYLNEIEKLDDLNSLKILTSKILNDYGFDKFSYIGFNARREINHKTNESAFIRSSLVQSTFPKNWIEHYDKNSFLYIDPLISSAKSSLLPFRWHGEEKIDKVSRAQRRVFEEGKSFGIKRGVVIPIHAPGGDFATMALATDDSRKNMETLWQAKKHDLHLIGLYFHATVWENVLQRKIKPTPALTPRELQCLEWSARGKTLWEVSKILGISEATSKTHLRGAMRKLDTFNKTHAVSKAVVHGLISV